MSATTVSKPRSEIQPRQWRPPNHLCNLSNWQDNISGKTHPAMVVYLSHPTSDQRGSSSTYRSQRKKNCWHRRTNGIDILLDRSEAIETDGNRNTTMSMSGLTNQQSKIRLTQPCINHGQGSRCTAGRRSRVDQGGTLTAISRPGRCINRDRPSEIA